MLVHFMSVGKRSRVKVERSIFIPFFCRPIMRQLEPPGCASPRLCSDYRTKGRKYLFESPQRFAGPIRQEFVAERSECVINKAEFSFLISH
jgi:hypothetical protein